MKNPYIETVRFFAKCDDLILQRENDGNYSISDGHALITMTSEIYEFWFHNEKPRIFPVMEAGKSKRGQHEIERLFDFYKLYNEIDYDPEAAQAIDTKYTRTVPADRYSKKDRSINIFLAYKNNRPYTIEINSAFVKAFNFVEGWKAASPLKPLYGEYFTSKCLMLPIKPETDPEEAGECFEKLAWSRIPNEMKRAS